jgi:hypothetical protein
MLETKISVTIAHAPTRDAFLEKRGVSGEKRRLPVRELLRFGAGQKTAEHAADPREVLIHVGCAR